MVKKLTPADLLFLQAQTLFGPNPPAGTPVDSLLGLRNVDGGSNNLTHLTIADGFIDQYGHLVNTDTFGNADQPFIHQTTAVFGSSYAQGLSVLDASPRVI